MCLVFCKKLIETAKEAHAQQQEAKRGFATVVDDHNYPPLDSVIPGMNQKPSGQQQKPVTSGVKITQKTGIANMN